MHEYPDARHREGQEGSNFKAEKYQYAPTSHVKEGATMSGSNERELELHGSGDRMGG